MKNYFILFFLFLLPPSGFAQNKITELRIGDKVPDVMLSNILGVNKPVKLSDLEHGDLLIINFWATWCVPCMHEMPLLDSMVNESHGRVKVLSVAYEPAAKIKSTLATRKDIPTTNLVMLTDDILWIQYFPHRFLPHNIWIDRNGIIKNITGFGEVNRPNLKEFINNSKLNVEMKEDKVDFDYFKTFHLKDSDFFYRSIYAGYSPGINSGTVVGYHNGKGERSVNRFFMWNSTKQNLIWSALSMTDEGRDYFKLMKIETNDSTRFFIPSECPISFKNSGYLSTLEWKKKNAVCFELTMPNYIKDSTFFEYLVSQLKPVLQINVRKENTLIPCCILRMESGRSVIASSTDSSYIKIMKRGLRAQNVSVLRFFQYLNRRIKPDLNAMPLDPPYIDETHINHNISIDLDWSDKLPTYAEIREMLSKKYGFIFKIEQHLYPHFIVKDLAP